ncbi:hypothetical protein K7X08_037684 [Anisodus acutangulus]|uniref:PPM-type phosphatase domain-containing protein n=1 Tax=Anisodus acutangulus TaxID=402998 RepID=A0A9Q1MXF8_9SOLA|nr:hypothetical protein K7X08_037684 [Anisodus acutangulus]
MGSGENRVHIVVSDEHGWVFVGIYDGFNGTDAADFLVNNLYSNVFNELKGFLWNDKLEIYYDSTKNGTVPLENSGVMWESFVQNQEFDEKLNNLGTNGVVAIANFDVLKALSEALRKTEASYLEMADTMMKENPELALMGSCVLVMLLNDKDVYLMNEVLRIRSEHLDDASVIPNDRVKGSLKVTRAFGAGYLKEPKWSNALLEVFSIDYVGNSPYINCLPSLYHHKLSPRDRLLILSSDGFYQYITNEEAVSEVGSFMSIFPEGDPSQHLVEEVLFRAAKKVGMDFHELLDIPPGDRRRYYDDVSIIIISFEGKIWKSSV